MFPFQIRKFRTLTELIVDAQDYIKNPYKGKKLKVIRFLEFLNVYASLYYALTEDTCIFNAISLCEWF